MQIFPTDWRTAVVLVAHPDDVEYGMAAAVDRWTGEGRTVSYLLATSGEAGIEGMAAEVAGPLREQEQLRSADRVGVKDVAFLGFPDSRLSNTYQLRTAIAAAVADRQPELVLIGYFGAEWAPDVPNQSDHMEFGRAAVQALDSTDYRLFEQAVQPDHLVDVDGHTEAAIRSLAEHHEYLSVLKPQTPVRQQAEKQVLMSCPERAELNGHRGVGFRLLAPSRVLD